MKASFVPTVVSRWFGLGGALWSVGAAFAQTVAPLAIQRPTRAGLIDFRREVLPFLQANCVPCHNQTSTKADLSLETPASMLKGGESGPAIVPGDAEKSLLVRVSSHAEKPRMPPRENKVNAVDLTPEQLGVLARWIEEGARAGDQADETVPWLDAAPELRAIYSAAWSGDGMFVACGQGSRVFVYHRPTQQLVTELTVSDSTSPRSAAHRDIVGAVAIRPDGLQLASGGFREVKLWRRRETAFRPTPANPIFPTNGLSAKSRDGSRSIGLGTNGVAILSDAEGKTIAELGPDPRAWGTLQDARRSLSAVRSEAAVVQKRLELAEKEQTQQNERLGRAREALIKAAESLKERSRAQLQAEAALALAESELASLPQDSPEDPRKTATQKVETTRKGVEEARRGGEEARRKHSVSQEELRLAELGWQKSQEWLRVWQDSVADATERLTLAEQDVQRREKESAPLGTPLVVLSEDACWAAIAHSNRIALASGRTGEPIDTWDAPGEVEGLAFGLGSLRVRTDGGVYERDLLPGWELERTLGDESGSPFPDRIGALAYSPDGRRLAIGAGEPSRAGHVHWWDPAAGNFAGGLTNLHSDSVLSLAFSPDGSWLISGGADRMARLVDVRLGLLRRTLEGHTGHVLAAAWKPDNATVASGGADLAVKFWDAITGERRKQAGGFEREVTGVAFLRDDRWVAAGSAQELRVINENGETVRSLSGVTDAIHALAVTTDGSWIAAGGEDGILRIWNAEGESPAALLVPPHRKVGGLSSVAVEQR